MNQTNPQPQSGDQRNASNYNNGMSLGRSNIEPAEPLEPTHTHATYIDDKDELATLSEDHKSYLLHRHGTIELDPVPGHGNADPYNWPPWKVRHSPCRQLPRNLRGLTAYLL